MTISTRSKIKNSIDAKLREISTSIGYQTDVVKVFSDEAENDDKIPMGLELDQAELPSIISLAGDDTPGRADPGKGLTHGCWYGNWELELQLWHEEVTDAVMHAFVRDVYKALYAGSSSGTKNNAFRSLGDKKIYDLKPLSIEHDLNMIEANRCFTCFFLVQYTSELWNL
jgi:hypothetical protein